MSSICSRHKHHKKGCPLCEAKEAVTAAPKESSMEPSEINRLIAEKVMGWTITDFFQGHKWETKEEWWCGKDYRKMVSVKDFDPYHRIEHAMMALEKFKFWSIYKSPDICTAYLDCSDHNRDESAKPRSASSHELCAAICLAIVETVNGE